MNNYIGKNIYLGIDVHKRTYSVTAIFDGCMVKRDTMIARPESLIKWCEKFFKGSYIHSVYEASFCGLVLHRTLIAAGINNIVVHPASVETEARNRSKTDKRDSFKLAIQLEARRLKCIHIPHEEREKMRLLSRLYETYVRHRHRVGCQLKFLLYNFGMIDCHDKRQVSERWIKRVLKIDCSPEIKYAMNEFAQHWLYLSQQIKKIKKQLELQAIYDADLHKVYTNFLGVGLISGRHLANELGDFSQFKNEKKLYAFVGVTPREYSSGEHVCLGHITHQGNPTLRKILVQCAWIAISKDKHLKNIFDKIAHRQGKKRAIVAIARKLLGQMRACFRKIEQSKKDLKDEKNKVEQLTSV